MSISRLQGNTSDFEYELVPAGLYKARCSIICDLGMKGSGQWAAKHKLYWAFQLVETKMTSEDRPFSIGEQLSVTINSNSSGTPSKLRARLEGWRGRGYTDEEVEAGVDLSAVIGQACQIQVMHEPDKSDQTKIWPRIATILPATGIEVPPLIGEQTFFDWVAPGQELSLPEFLRNKIGTFPGQDVAASPGPQPPAPAGAPAISDGVDFDDDIPF